MAKVPLYQEESVSLTGNIPRVNVDYQPFFRGAAAIGGAIAYRAERVRKADEQMMKINMDKQFSDMKIASMDVRGRSADGLADTLVESKGKMSEDSVDKIENPVTKQNMELYFEKSFNDQTTWTQAYEMKQMDGYLKEVDVANVDNAARKLDVIPVGDVGTIDTAAAQLTQDAREREGELRWSKATNENYHQAVVNKLYGEQITRWYKESPDLAYEWFDKNKDVLRERVSPGVFNTIANLHDAEYGNAKTLEIYKTARALFGDDNLGAAMALSDPEKLEERFGVNDYDYKYANAAAVMFKNMAGMNASVDKQQKASRLDTNAKAINEASAAIMKMKDVNARNSSMQNLIKAIRTNPDMDVALREKYATNLTKANYDIDPTRVAGVKAQIDNGTITRNYQLSAELGDGIGPSTQPLEAYLKQKLLLDKEGNINYVSQAQTNFIPWAKAVGVPAEQLGLFTAKLEALRRAKGYSPNDPRVVIELVPEVQKKDLYVSGTGTELTAPSVSDRKFFRNEDERRVFQRPVSDEPEDVAAFLKGNAMTSPPAAGSPAQQPPGESVASNTPKPTAEVRQEAAVNFKLLYHNPYMIPGDTVEKKMEYMDARFFEIRGKSMTPDQKALLHMEIDTGGIGGTE